MLAMAELRRITEIPCTCNLCEWSGLSGECESGDDGELMCPKCWSYDVVIHYLPHEMRE